VLKKGNKRRYDDMGSNSNEPLIARDVGSGKTDKPL
jgi:hypothetical protein